MQLTKINDIVNNNEDFEIHSLQLDFSFFFSHKYRNYLNFLQSHRDGGVKSSLGFCWAKYFVSFS